MAKLTDENLPNGTTGREAEHVPPDGGVPRHEAQRGRELARAPGDVHAEPLADARMHQPGAQAQVPGRDGGAEQVVRAHHLRARVAPERREDVVLRRVRQPVEQQVDPQQQQAPRRVRVRVRRGAVLLRLAAARVQREHGDAERHGPDDKVLVHGVPAAEERGVQQHDGDELAGLGEEEGDVVDVREGGVAERRGERRGHGHEEQGDHDAPRREDGRQGACAVAPRQVDVARNGGEEGLDCVEEDGVLEHLGLVGGAIRCGRELFLKICPGQAGEISYCAWTRA